MEPITTEKQPKQPNPLFPFMSIGSLVYAFFYTFFLYKNASGITYPFFIGGTCLFFFSYLKKSGTAVKNFSIFITISLILLGISTCCTDSWVLVFFNKTGIFLLFFYLILHSTYEDKKWNLFKYLSAIITVVFTSIGFIFRPFTDFAVFLDKRKSQHAPASKLKEKGKYIFLGFLIALPLLFVIGLLLCSADIVFLNIFDTLFTDIFTIQWNENIWGMIGLFIFAFFSSYCILCKIAEHNIKEEVTDGRTAEPLIAITFTGMISLVYLLFCIIQVVYLFGGLGTLPEGYTYAKYAREGFFQLVFVCLINLALVLLCTNLFRENLLLKGILTFISLCTYMMIASSVYKMILYIQVYHLTFLRVFVLWALFVILLLMTGAIVSIYQFEFPLIKYGIVVVTVCYLIFSFAHPDYWIACYNLSHAYTQAADPATAATKDDSSDRSYTDFYYLRHLSADAAPVIFVMADELGYGDANDQNRWFASYASNLVKNSYDWHKPIENRCLPQKQPVRKINISRQTAYRFYTNYYNQHEDFQTWIVSYL